MSRFQEVAQVVLGHEGGLSDHPADKGGRTNLGITQSTLTGARKSISGLPEKVDDLTAAQALEIYRKLYWDKSKCDEIPTPLDFLVFDAAINCGVGGAGIQLQRALNKIGASLSVDGAIGTLTLTAVREAVRKGRWGLLLAGALWERVIWHNDIIAKDASQAVFKEGWLNRIAKNATIAGVE